MPVERLTYVMFFFAVPVQLENVDLLLADHMQRVVKPNFPASWDEIGEENEVEETFALASMKDIVCEWDY